MPANQVERWAARLTLSDLEERITGIDVWVAETDEGIVGWVAVRGDYLESLYTDPEFERRGVATQLLELAERLVLHSGHVTVHAEASWNAEDFYLRRGYMPLGPRPVDGPRPIMKRLTGGFEE